MSKEMKLIPELRFPEFTGNDGWKLDNVNSLFDLQDGYPFSSKAFTSKPENGRQVIRITDINNQNKNSEKVFISEEKIEELGIDAYSVKQGDLLLSLTGAAGFNFYLWKNGAAFINQRTMKITPKDSKNEFLKVLLSPLIHEKINGIGTGQNNNLSKDALKGIEFPVPHPKEQQKIASCLSSLDELIAAHNDKLDALKDHKKGLLQNLFPQEGETVPRVRFPEFEDDGEWVEKKLGDAADFINGRAYKKEELLTSGKYRVLRVGNFFTNNEWYYSDLELGEDKYCDKGDLLYAWSASFGPRIWKEEKVIYHYHIWKVVEKSGIDKDFLYVLLDFETENIKAAQSRGLGMKHLTKSGIESWESTIPPTEKEQNKIASCLSAVDELITAQQEKIEELQQHKKGLMQGLFPKMV